ncbi:porin [Enterovibrio norvegicus]|uniref:Outer membrane protein OmpT n=1 Tax=Enterovibrio norvegicus DSM 15893 TaxID=1121869 RepID=A0A1I5PM98_9GAMM|nr:porin [Enterovibrio norvegicus]SFP35179.1 outer membrane protein OmpT [Enterovibrio norvegicus DSM 15893]
MNKKILAVAIPAVLLASNVSAYEVFSSDEGSVEVYGQLRAKLTKDEGKDIKLDDGSSRAGVNATYTVNEYFDVLGAIEYSLADEFKNRYSYIGASGDWGKVTLGKQYLTADDLWGVDNSYFYGGSHIVEGTISGGKHDSSVRYIFENDDFYVDASYAFAEDDANPEVFELFGRVNVAGFDVTAGVSQATQGHAAFDGVPAGELEDFYHTLWVERTFGDLSVGVQYASSKIESDAVNMELDRTGYGLALSYGLSEKSSVYGGYEFSEYDVKDAASSVLESNDATLVYLGAVHKFNSFFRVYGEAAYADGTTAGFTNNKNDWTVAAGATADSEMKYAIGARVYW